MRDTHYIINPVANGGAGLKAWKAFEAAWAERIDSAQVTFTEHSGHARKIAAQCPACKTLAVAGGDGTIGEVISGIMDGPEPRPKLAVIPCGTGNDIGRSAGVFTLENAISALRSGTAEAFDLIRVERTFDNRTETRHAFLFANAGFSAIPMMKPWMKRLFGATGAYYLSTLLQVLVFRPTPMSVNVDGQEYNGRTFLIIAGNTEYAAGGSMRIAPGASPNDGALNISIIKPVPLRRLISKVLGSIANGSHINEPEVSYFQGKVITVNSEPSVPLDLDGELFGTTPATITVCPSALQILSNN